MAESGKAAALRNLQRLTEMVLQAGAHYGHKLGAPFLDQGDALFACALCDGTAAVNEYALSIDAQLVSPCARQKLCVVPETVEQLLGLN